MTTSRSADAASRHLRTLQRLVACVSDAVLRVTVVASRAPSGVHKASPARAVPSALRGRIVLQFWLEQYFRVLDPRISDRAVNIVGYGYAFDDSAGREIVAYHWHPDVPGVVYPHLHIGHGAVQPAVLDRASLSPAHNALLPELARAHLPTGTVELTAVLRLAIEHLGVEPRRADWASILR